MWYIYNMGILQIDVIDPTVWKILDELAASNRIKISSKKESTAQFLDQVKQLRRLNIDVSEKEILDEVQAVRSRELIK